MKVNIMSSYNKVILVGRLTRDPEIKQLPSGTVVGKFSIAVSRQYIDKNEQEQEEVNFFDCELFGKKAETFAKYHKKGRQVFVEGTLRQDTWEDDGQKRSKVLIRVEDFVFLDGKRDDVQESASSEAKPKSQGNKVTSRKENIPF